MSTATDRAEYTAGLRALADLLETTPDLPLPDTGDLYWYLFGSNMDGQKKFDLSEQKAEAARIVRLIGGKHDKFETGELYRFRRHLHGLRLEVVVDRPAVCERVVVATENVTKQIPDPAVVVPLVEVTETVEQVEWRCKPLLAEVDDASQAVAHREAEEAARRIAIRDSYEEAFGS